MNSPRLARSNHRSPQQKLTKLGQAVLDALCEFDAETGPYGIGGCFFSIDIRQARRHLDANGISPSQLGGIVSRLIEQGYLYNEEAENDWDIWITNTGWMAWSEWDDGYLLDIFGMEPGQDWDFECIESLITDDSVRTKLREMEK